MLAPLATRDAGSAWTQGWLCNFAPIVVDLPAGDRATFDDVVRTAGNSVRAARNASSAPAHGVLAILAAVLITWVPGTAVLLLARKSIFMSVAAAPAVTLGVVYLGTTLWGLLGLSWTVWTLALTTAIVGGVVWLVARTWPGRSFEGGNMPTKRT